MLYPLAKAIKTDSWELMFAELFHLAFYEGLVRVEGLRLRFHLESLRHLTAYD